MYSQLFKTIWCLWVTFTNQLNHSLPQNLVLRKQIPYNFSTFLSKLGHCFTRFQDRKTKDPFALFVTFDDNSCIVLDPKNGRVISTIYPPPTATSICKVVYSLHTSHFINCYYVLRMIMKCFEPNLYFSSFRTCLHASFLKLTYLQN